MTTQNSAKQPVAPEDFKNFLQGLELQTMRVRSLKVDAKREFSHSDMKNIRHSENYSFVSSEDGQLRIDTRHEIRLIGARRKKLGSISVVFGWYYQSKKEITDEIFEIFAPMVRFQAWPHLREIVANTATRANWPRVTIPLLIAQKPAKSEE